MAEGGKYLNMKYWELLKEENEAVAERHELAMERIGHMKEEATVGELAEVPGIPESVAKNVYDFFHVE